MAKVYVSFSLLAPVLYSPSPKAECQESLSYEGTDCLNLATASVAVMIKKAGGGNGKGKNKRN